MSENETLGERIQRIREARGITASGLARLVDVTPTAVWNWERSGVRPRAETLSTIAQVLGTTAGYLATGETTDEISDGQIPITVAEAKKRLALAHNVSPDAIEIIIRP